LYYALIYLKLTCSLLSYFILDLVLPVKTILNVFVVNVYILISHFVITTLNCANGVIIIIIIIQITLSCVGLYLGKTVTNENLIQAEIKMRLNSGNACHHSVHSAV
jgi:hypothetical protein